MDADQGQEAERLLRSVDPPEIKTVTPGGSAVSSATLVSQDMHLLKCMLFTSRFGKEFQKHLLITNKETLRVRCGMGAES